MFPNCSPNLQLADSKDIFYLSHLIQFTLNTEVKKNIFLREDAVNSRGGGGGGGYI